MSNEGLATIPDLLKKQGESNHILHPRCFIDGVLFLRHDADGNFRYFVVLGTLLRQGDVIV